MAKGEKTLRQIIKGDFLTQINEIWRRGESYQDAQKGDNIQGELHCKAVETNLGKLIPDTKKEKELKQIDLFVLSAAACLHDIGKVVDDNAKGWKSDHGKRSMQIILEEYDKLGLDRGQAIAVGYMVSAHGDGRLDELPRKPIVLGSEEINVIELAAIFRLADMLDTTYQRAPEILSKIKFPDGDIPSKWRGRQSINGWYLDEKDRIILQAIPKEDEIDAVYTLKAIMNEDLAKISPYLKLAGYPSELGELDIGDVFLKSGLKEKAILQRPFPGMAFYTKDDARIFKGRDDEIENLLPRISNWPITLLIGESGAGKTSLIHAGLFPKLETMSWKFVWTRPFDNPEENIKKMIWSAFFEGEVDQRKSLLDVMKQAAEMCKPHQLLVVMDQFEDVLNCNVQEILDDFSLHLMAVQTDTIIPNLKVLISFREDAFVKLNSRLLKKITGSAQQFPSVELERLTRDGAKAALLSGLENAGIGLDPRQEKGQEQLLEIILDDTQKDADRLYPPYIQMVAETLCTRVDQKNPIITREIYLDQLEGADNIIARYLMERLNEFGYQKEKAEKVLVFLTSSTGKKAQKSLIELSRETEIEIDELKEIVNKMIDLRMARVAGDDKFEIIHDYLGKVVDEELVKKEERTIKFLEEQLNLFYQNYKVHKTPIMAPPFMASLYRNRKRIKINEEKYPLILSTCLFEDYGLGWYWLKDVNTKKMFEMINGLIYHDNLKIRDEAIKIFVEIAKHEDWDKIIERLYDEDWVVRKAAIEAFVKIAKSEDRYKIPGMLHDENKDVRKAAIEAFVKIAKPEYRYKILGMLHDESKDVRKAAIEALVKIAKPEDRYKILGMLHDESKGVRKAAKKALAKIARPGGKGSRKWHKMIASLRDKNRGARRAAEKAFVNNARLGNRYKIIPMLHDEDEVIRRVAKKALAKIASPEDRDEIIEMLHDRDEGIRIFAKKALAKIAKDEDRNEISAILYDENMDVRRGDIKVGKIAEHEDIDRIIEMLHDRDEVVREVAVEAFVKIAEHEDIDRIIEMLHDSDEVVRRAAVEAFVRIAKTEDRDKIIERLYDENWFVRRAAVEAFVKIAKTEDREYLLDLLADEAQGWSKKQKDFFELVSDMDRKFYCPYFKDEEDMWKRSAFRV